MRLDSEFFTPMNLQLNRLLLKWQPGYARRQPRRGRTLVRQARYAARISER